MACPLSKTWQPILSGPLIVLRNYQKEKDETSVDFFSNKSTTILYASSSSFAFLIKKSLEDQHLHQQQQSLRLCFSDIQLDILSPFQKTELYHLFSCFIWCFHPTDKTVSFPALFFVTNKGRYHLVCFGSYCFHTLRFCYVIIKS